jgi:type VI protein secretion system component VasK
MSDIPTTAPFVTRDTRVRTTYGTIFTIVGFAVAAAIAWTLLKSEVESNTRTIEAHDARLRAVERKIEADHDLLLEIRGDLKAIRAKQQ